MRRLAILSCAILCLALTANAAERLKYAHVLDRQHPYHKVAETFAKRVAELTNNEIRIRVYPNGELGWTREVLELLQNGSIAFTQSNVSSLESFAKEYTVMSLPYLFDDMDHFYRAIASPTGKRILASSAEKGLVGVAYHENGKRSFYGNKPYRTPVDLKGAKIRVMPSPTAIRMVELMGGSPTPLAFSEIYTALQQGVVDGAESNATVLTASRHGEVAKFFSMNEHTMPADVLVMSTAVWNRLSPEHQAAIMQAGDESTQVMKRLYGASILEAERESRESLGVQFIEVDKEPFRQAVQPIYEELKAKDPELYSLVEALRKE